MEGVESDALADCRLPRPRRLMSLQQTIVYVSTPPVHSGYASIVSTKAVKQDKASSTTNVLDDGAPAMLEYSATNGSTRAQGCVCLIAVEQAAVYWDIMGKHSEHGDTATRRHGTFCFLPVHSGSALPEAEIQKHKYT